MPGSGEDVGGVLSVKLVLIRLSRKPFLTSSRVGAIPSAVSLHF